MCGIAGAIALDGRPMPDEAARRALAALAHRGPDGDGIMADGPVTLAHRRLSILDPTPAGSQPMVRDGVWLIHNGEVYNFLELAAELEGLGRPLSSGTDTEVIIEAYLAWGLDAFARFNGMWALALWDSPRRRLVLSRDRVGVKPLYVRRTSRTLAFASEVPALLAARPLDDSDAWRPEPEPRVVRDFLLRGLVDHADLTFVDGVAPVPPAHHMVVEDGVARLQRYWGPPALSDDDRASVRTLDARRDDELVERFAHVFDDAVRLRLRSDVPIGSCLSGGLDSSSIVLSVAEHLRHAGADGGEREQVPRYAFHARFPEQGVDESAFAEQVAAIASIELVYSNAPASLIEATTSVLAAQGEPFASTSILAQYEVMRAAHRQGLKVLLDGQGADELLGGYPRYLGYRAAGLMRTGRVLDAVAELRASTARGTLPAGDATLGLLRGLAGVRGREVLRAASRGRFGIRVGPSLRGVPTALETHDRPGTLLARHLWQDISREGLPALLRYEDRNSMAFAIEARVPFLDYRLVELACGLPDRLRVSRGITKIILRKAMRSRLPREVLDRRDKMGFVTPQASWTAQAGVRLHELLRRGHVLDRGWVDGDEVERLLAEARKPGRVNEQLWRLVVLELWLAGMS